MALKLKKSPLPHRVNPTPPLRDWIWTEPGQYNGVLADSETALIPLLAHPGRVLRLDQGQLCLLFDEPATLDPKKVAAIPLKHIGPETYVSYDTQETRQPGIYVIDQGAPKHLNLASAEPVDPITFWDFSTMSVVTGQPLETSQTALPKVGKPAEPQQSSTDAELRRLVGDKSFLKNIHDEIETTKDYRLSLFASSWAGFVIRLIASIVLITFYILVAGTAIRAGAAMGTFGLILAFAFIAWYFRLFGRSEGHAEAYEAAAQRRGPGLLDGLRGLALWNTSLGNKLRREVQRHLDEVSKMIDRGDIDRALKRAMSIAQSEERKAKRRSPLMTALPKERASLDFDLDRQESDTVALPGDWNFQEVRDKYQKLAEDLSDQGDHRRAAFIYAELLSLIPEALAELEKIKAYEEAAKLATARNQEGAVIARLWFLAGKKEIALLIARRHNCMATLATVSETDPEFSAFVRKHWVNDLVAEGDLPRAVEESADIEQLHETHLNILAKAIAEGHLQDVPVLERAVQSLPWRIDALNGAALDGSVGGKIESVVSSAISAPDAGETRQRLKAAVERMDADNPRRSALTDALIRASLAFDADTPYAMSARELRVFAGQNGCEALAEDLRQIHRAAPTPQRNKSEFSLPISGKNTWTMAAALSGGTALVANAAGEMAFLDSRGSRRWTDHMPDLVGIIPIGPGRRVLLVQGNAKRRRISMLDTARRSYKSIGDIQLLAWSNYADKGIWQVQTPTTIAALDLSKLVADAPAFETLWSITQTVPVKAISFCFTEGTAEWLTQRIDDTGPGLIERWSVSRSWQDLSVWLEPEDNSNTITHHRQIWRGDIFTRQDYETGDHPKHQFYGMMSNYENERELTKTIQSDLSKRKAFASVVETPMKGAFALEITGSEKSVVTLVKTNTNEPIARLKGHMIAAQSSSRDGDHLIVLTKTGLVVLCDFKKMSAVVCP